MFSGEPHVDDQAGELAGSGMVEQEFDGIPVQLPPSGQRAKISSRAGRDRSRSREWGWKSKQVRKLESWLRDLDHYGFPAGGADEAMLVLGMLETEFWPMVLSAKRYGKRRFMVGELVGARKVALVDVVEKKHNVLPYFTYGIEALEELFPQ